MEYKGKVVAGLLTATCVFSIIALILSAVDVKDVFLPPASLLRSYLCWARKRTFIDL